MGELALVLLSGGLDSATTLACSKVQGFVPEALTFDYDQRHRVEIQAAHRVAAALGVQNHHVVHLDARIFQGSALTGGPEVPKMRAPDRIGNGIPVTYVPARNTVFLAHALAYAEVIGAADIFIGVNALDYSGYPDCRPEYIRAFETMANLATKAGVNGRKLTIHAPLIEMTKAQIIRRAHELGVDLSLTHSCYDPAPDGRSCGQCDSCQLRREGFSSAGLTDPLSYLT